MTQAYLEILASARQTVVWEIVLVSLLFLAVGVGVFLIPFEIRGKSGETRRLFRMREKWQMWVLKAVLWAVILGGGLWFGLARGNAISAINADVAAGSVTEITSEYAVEKPPFSLGKRRTVWVHDGESSLALTQYGAETEEGVFIGTVVYAPQSRIVLTFRKDR